jgi:radical SAM-linked protein
VRIRVRYRKQDRLRFISAIDLGRVWERALRRSDLPIAYSEGFSPHPKVSFTDALPLGYASVAEYAELTFAGPIDVSAAVGALNAAFPDGIGVTAAVVVEDGAPRFSKLLAASVWDVDYPAGTDLHDAVAAATSAVALVVPRQRKGDAVDVDIRPALAQLSTDGARLRATVHHTDHLPDAVAVAVRPSEIDLALRSFSPDLAQPVLVTRLAQGRPGPDGLVEALTRELIEPLTTLQRQAT